MTSFSTKEISGNVPSVNAQSPAQFPIVAIGASAGGLGALEDFFAVMPDDSGIAFIVTTERDLKKLEH